MFPFAGVCFSLFVSGALFDFSHAACYCGGNVSIRFDFSVSISGEWVFRIDTPDTNTVCHLPFRTV